MKKTEKGEELAEMTVCPYQLNEVETEQTDEEEEINNIEEDKIFEKCDMFDDKIEVDKKFITSPAQIESQRKIKLQNAPITDEDRSNFKELCNEYTDIFSRSSEDIGHTPLLKMDIDTGDSPPVCQRPYSLSLKHVEWVTKELEILEESRSDIQKCITLGKSNSYSAQEIRTRGNHLEEECV